MNLQQQVLRTDVSGMPLEWIGYQDAVRLITLEQVSYALGSENQNLPSFVAIPDPRGVPQASVNNWGSGFLPAEFQGTPFSSKQPVRHLAPPAGIGRDVDQAARSLLQRMNQRHLERHPEDGKLAARIVLRGLGTPLGYVDQSNKIITNPSADTIVTGSAIFLMVNHDAIPEGKLVEQCVAEKT